MKIRSLRHALGECLQGASPLANASAEHAKVAGTGKVAHTEARPSVAAGGGLAECAEFAISGMWGCGLL